ncbi:MAG TPA: prolyl aminopeptidase [Gammaproteobacteria bacterium]|jgi:proline iminopeptidase|nr:prolyl aminopeptidase [Gammaproteobacteria bacterium]
MSKKSNLYPKIDPFDTGFLMAGEHEIYYEQSGNPEGKPAVFLHGGPGGGGSEEVRRFFNPDKYRIIVFDQRGCGRSKPHACLSNNTTWHLVDDIENLRKLLNIDKWLVFGGSWGSTLALAYSQCHPNSVTEIILRGIFLLRKHELDWFYQYGASQIFPEAWEDFIDVIDEDQRENLMLAYQKIFSGAEENKKLEAALAWSRWEAATSNLHYKESQVNEFSNPKFALEFAQIENHYFVNKGFFNEEDQLLEGIDTIRHIPCVIVQGRYDVVCPISTAWELSKKWPEADLIIAPNSGHSAFEVELSKHLVKITDSFA